MSMKFDVEKTIYYWSESAEYDLKTAESLFITEMIIPKNVKFQWNDM
jgi:hypothetical protein